MEGELTEVLPEAAARHKGSVKWFNVTKGFGFITPEDGGEDLFAHQTNINSQGFRSLREGEAVEFDVETSADGRAKAINISGPGGAAPQGAPHRLATRSGASGSTPALAPPGGRGGRGSRGRSSSGAAGSPGGGGRGGPAAAMGGFYPGYEAAGYPPPFYVSYYFPSQGYGQDMSGGGRGRGRFGPAPAGGMYALPGGMPGPFPGGYPGGFAPAGPPGGMVVGPGPSSSRQAGQHVAATPPSGLQVVVHNLPWTCTWQQLKDVFSEWKVVHADVVYDSWERSRGFGTVRFSNTQDAEAACQKLNNSQIEGRTLSVRIDRFA